MAGLAQTRERGYAVEDQENELGITCVAIGIPDAHGRTAVAISVSAPSVHMPATRCAEVVDTCATPNARCVHYFRRFGNLLGRNPLTGNRFAGVEQSQLGAPRHALPVAWYEAGECSYPHGSVEPYRWLRARQ